MSLNKRIFNLSLLRCHWW